MSTVLLLKYWIMRFVLGNHFSPSMDPIAEEELLFAAIAILTARLIHTDWKEVRRQQHT